MTRKTLLLAAALAVLASHAAPYQPIDIDTIIVKNDSGQSSANIGAYAQAVNHLAKHAGDYPPKFDSEEDREKAVKDVQFLAALADMLGESARKQGDIAVLKLNAQLYWIGHNLDQPGLAQQADESFAAWLKHAPDADKAEVSEWYGRFLASSAQGERAKPLLQSAYDSGRKESALPLAMVNISQGDKAAAETLLREYTQNFPQDTQAQKLLEAVESGQVEVRTTQHKPQN